MDKVRAVVSYDRRRFGQWRGLGVGTLKVLMVPSRTIGNLVIPASLQVTFMTAGPSPKQRIELDLDLETAADLAAAMFSVIRGYASETSKNFA